MTLRERRRRRRKKGSRGLRVIFLVVGATAGLAIASLGGYAISVVSSTPPTEKLVPVPKGTSSIVYASDGSFLGYIQSDESRTPVPSKDMPDFLRKATVAIEDEHFYKHSGVDYTAIARAAVENVQAGKTVQGGSTITQQLVRNTLIGREPTLKRKLREAALAQKLEKRYSKREILERYLNSVPYGTVDGQTAVGVQAAAQTYFSKDAKDLTIEQSALLAGLPQAPSRYNPLNNPKIATKRRSQVLKKMAKLGYLSAERSRQASSTSLGLKRGYRYSNIKQPFFFDFVKDRLIDKYGVNTVQKGGLKIHTTINPKFQKAAKSAIGSTLNVRGDPSSAVVTIDTSNGYIRAMASNQNYRSQKFNLAVQGHRQPGSAFKTMALTEAMRRGVDPDSTYYESKKLNIPIPGYGNWEVSTYDNSYGGRMSLARATLKSDNTVFAQLSLDLGPKRIADTAHDLGIKTELEGVPSETLGGLRDGVSPLEIANAYATLAAGGLRCEPIPIKNVEFPDDKTEQWGNPKCKQAITDGEAYEVTKILEKNVEGGTGTGAQIGCPLAGKTGTTDNFNDAWFIGYTPSLATSVWVGYPDSNREMRSIHGVSVAGGTFPADIFAKYMSVAVDGNCKSFKEPAEPVSFAPFFGKYATQGSKSSKGDDSGYFDYEGDGRPSGDNQNDGDRVFEPGEDSKPKEQEPEEGDTGKPDGGEESGGSPGN